MQKLKELHINVKGNVHRNLPPAVLSAMAIERNEGELSRHGSLTVRSGKYTGRAAKDRFILYSPETSFQINWGEINQPISNDVFEKIYKKMTNYFSNLDDIFIFDGYAGADLDYSMHVRVINELASDALFSNNLLKRPLTQEELGFHKPQLTILRAPGCLAEGEKDGVNSDAFIIFDMAKRIILIGGTRYGCEIKKAVFSYINYLYPQAGIFPMHCAANMGMENRDTALFFGLSGTGKTTLANDPSRQLIGDDEHTWTENGIFNIEGGCGAKCINLNKEIEPHLFCVIKEGTYVENVIMNPITKEYDFFDASITENTRIAFPLHFLPNFEPSGSGSHPKNIFFLTADAFGVMPPIAKLDNEQAAYYFLSGFTSKLAGTENGINEPTPSFSAFFGEPFMPLRPSIYVNLFKKYLNKYKPNVFLINTGWNGGAYGVGKRIDLHKITKPAIAAALAGEFDNIPYEPYPVFNFGIPIISSFAGKEILNPRNTWENTHEYGIQARSLAKMFKDNLKRFKEIKGMESAGPKL